MISGMENKIMLATGINFVFQCIIKCSKYQNSMIELIRPTIARDC